MSEQDIGDVVLSVDAFVRSIGINKTTAHLFLLGAGASVSSGMPSAEQCIWEWKRDIFLTKNPGMEEQFSELSLVGVRQNIQRWLDHQDRYPRRDTPEEYGCYIEGCYPIPGDRRAYFQEKVREAQPYVGYRLLCHLAGLGMVRAIWSTNFDGLAARAAQEFHITPIEVGIDSQDRLPRVARKGELLCISLHGDYRYDWLKNTSEELQDQESHLRDQLVHQVQEAPLVVTGYSGRDASIMDTLIEAYSAPGTGALYWCGYGSPDPPGPIADLIQTARLNGYSAFYVPTDGFDDFLIRLALHCSEGEQQECARQLISPVIEESRAGRVPFEVASDPISTVIKSNAFELDCPSELLTFGLREWPKERVWSSIRDLVREHEVVAVPFRERILALGIPDDIKAAFAENIEGPVERTPVIEKELRYEDSAVVSLMKEALVNALAQGAGVNTDGRGELWFHEELERVQDSEVEYSIHESVLIFLRRIGQRQYLLLKPSLRIQDEQAEPAPEDVQRAAKLRILGAQFNNKFNQALNRWRQCLLPDGSNFAVYEYPRSSPSAFRFRIRRSPIFAEIGTSASQRSLQLPEGMKRLVKHRGVELSEPALLFSDRTGSGHAKDTHPIRGIVRNRPFDFRLTQSGLASSIRLGVVCPGSEAQLLSTYLRGALRQQRPLRSNPEYLLEYPGFDRAYGVALEVPDNGEEGWVTCSEPSSTDLIAGSRDLSSRIIQSIENLTAVYAPHAVLVFIPERWSLLRGYKTDNEKFDLHDFVKAHCVERGIPTQFLEEKTLRNEDQCSVWWWLSLALYVKSMRTPWVLESLDPDTAFVGLGFSIDPSAERGQQIVLGCSHIYSARGEGLQFRLSKIENPVFRGRNPHMSEEDARRLGETIRQLFFDARLTLPRRVVLHKRTPFIRQEREGLCQGLDGVDHLEMLEVQIDSALRYVASVWHDGKFDEDNFPVRRGTTVKLDDFSALVWVHGATAAIDPSRRYFQGRRRIPAPLIVRRHIGRSSLQTVAQELLALSKMNWNTFDLYTKLPATLHSSNEIARIGSLLQRFGPRSYDFRLFM